MITTSYQDIEIPSTIRTKAQLREFLGYSNDRTFRRHIQPILPVLIQLDYNPKQQYLTGKQVKVIADFLG